MLCIFLRILLYHTLPYIIVVVVITSRPLLVSLASAVFLGKKFCDWDVDGRLQNGTRASHSSRVLSISIYLNQFFQPPLLRRMTLKRFEIRGFFYCMTRGLINSIINRLTWLHKRGKCLGAISNERRQSSSTAQISEKNEQPNILSGKKTFWKRVTNIYYNCRRVSVFCVRVGTLRLLLRRWMMDVVEGRKNR